MNNHNIKNILPHLPDYYLFKNGKEITVAPCTSYVNSFDINNFPVLGELLNVCKDELDALRVEEQRIIKELQINNSIDPALEPYAIPGYN
jgi:hypothetical protein